MLLLILVVWTLFALFHRQIFTFFGADAALMPKVMEYAQWLIRFFPVFILPAFISSFIRNDAAPGLAMTAVIVDGCLNIFGDWFFCFPLGMGMQGAAIATVIGTSTQVIIMCSHFFTKKCTLRPVKPKHIFSAIRQTLAIGFGASILDLGAVILSTIMNNQITRYGNTDALAIYGVVATIASLFQALFCGVGQAIQPIVSANCGAKQTERIRSVWNMALMTYC